MAQISYIPGLFCVVVTLQLIDCGVFPIKPRRCCAPEQWEADVEGSDAVSKTDYGGYKANLKFAFDWPNRRWALQKVQTDNETENLHLIYDHKQGVKYALTGSGCFKTGLSGHMNRFCPAENATFDGTHKLGFGDSTLEYNVWSHEIFGIPIRSVTSYTVDGCYPLQDALVGLVQNNYEWEEGEEPCVPWEKPDKARNGSCYKSLKKRVKQVRGVMLTAHHANLNYRNFRKELSPDMFSVEEECQDVEHFDKTTFDYNLFIRGIIFKMKYF